MKKRYIVTGQVATPTDVTSLRDWLVAQAGPEFESIEVIRIPTASWRRITLGLTRAVKPEGSILVNCGPTAQAIEARPEFIKKPTITIVLRA